MEALKVSSKTDWRMLGGFPPVSLCRKRSLDVVVDSMAPGLKDSLPLSIILNN